MDKTQPYVNGVYRRFTADFLVWWTLGRVPSVLAYDAIQMLNRTSENAVLVDVRKVDAFTKHHVSGAQNWPLADITATISLDKIPDQFQSKNMLLVSEWGFMSAKAARSLQAIGLAEVYNVRGGLQEWAKAGRQFQTMRFSRFATLGKPDYYAFQEMSLIEQGAAVLASFVVKPFYMFLSVVLIWALRRLKSPDLAALRWGLILFFIGESFCATNFYIFHHDSYILEFFHSYGMVLSFAFIVYAFMEGLDSRLIKFSELDKKCAALELCGSCIKYAGVRCGMRRLFILLLPILIILSFIPLLAVPSLVSYNSEIFSMLYNHTNLVVFQLFESRYCPLLAIISFSIALLMIYIQDDQPLPYLSRIFFAAGLGGLGFSMFRLVFGMIYENNLVWSIFWEELTELIFVALVGGVLWIFRQRLFQEAVPGNRSITLNDILF